MQNILITGTSRGLGYELAKQFAEQGNRVYATNRNSERADKLHAVAAASNGRLTVHEMDIGDADSVKSFKAELGDTPIDILINNAGVWGGLETQVFANMDYENWAYELNIMLMGPFRVTQAFIDNVCASKQRKIITLTSQVSAHSYEKIIGYSYAAAKAGLNRCMTALARELAHKNIIITLLHPGWVRTDMAGPVADTDTPEAAADNIKLINGLTMKESGRFMKWNGEEHPW
jgi:NAD(P)-dependent dehydrogenase (short-subunit alcohol dehydrogenase family)